MTDNIDPAEQAQLLKTLWEEREQCGLLHVLDKMNSLLDKGLLKAEVRKLNAQSVAPRLGVC